MKRIVILVPGIMGSVLELNDEVIWPGPLSSRWLPYSNMPALLSEDLVATDCIREYFIVTFYQHLIDDLGACGFHTANGTLVIFAYDWRRDNSMSAAKLAVRIDQACEGTDTDVQISLVVHSMGGLVARHYLESQRYNKRPGFKCIHQVLFIGTPHRGAADALPAILGQEKKAWLSRAQVQLLANDPRYPSAYQLLPPRNEPFAWDASTGNGNRPLDIFHPAVRTRLGLSEVNMASAQAFHTTLDPAQRPDHVRYVCFVGTRLSTTTHAFISDSGTGGLVVRKAACEDGGDGTVPTWSALLPDVQRLFVAGDHETLYKNNALRSMLARCLGKEEVLRGVPDTVQVSLKDHVVDPGSEVQVLISFDQLQTNFSGILTVDPAVITSEGLVQSFAPPTKQHRVTYKGLGMEAMKVVFTAPELRGVYRVSFRDEIDKEPSGFDELLVQQ